MVDGTYKWLKYSNSRVDRDYRREAANKTILACHTGGYTLDGKKVHLQCLDDMVRRTRFFSAQDAALCRVASRGTPQLFKHAPGLLMDVAIDRTENGQKVALVNAASAYSAGGGFLVGARHALEESLCMASSLYKSLQAIEVKAKQMKLKAPDNVVPCRNRCGEAWTCHIPEDGVVLSPGVEVFRGGTFQGYPFLPAVTKLVAVISVAMPNNNSKVSDSPVDMPVEPAKYEKLVKSRFRAMAAAAVDVGAKALVVPDLGCGVFGNDPYDVGRYMGEVLRDEVGNAMSEIHLSGSKEFLAAFTAAFEGRPPPPRIAVPRACSTESSNPSPTVSPKMGL